MKLDEDKVQSLIHAYIDKQLSPSAREKFERYLQQNAAVRKQLELQQKLKLQLTDSLKQTSLEQQAINRLQHFVQEFKSDTADDGTSFDVQSEGIISDGVDDILEGRFGDTFSHSPRFTNAVMIACTLVLGIGLGYYFAPSPSGSGVSSFEQLALDAHTIYSAEKAHAIEVPASEKAQMMKWLSSRLTVSVGPADFESFGFQLLGGRLLPSAGKHAAFYHYQNEQGKRLSLYIRQHTSEDIKSGCTQATKANYCEWSGVKLIYLLTSELPIERLSAMQRSAAEQLNK